MKKLPAKSFEFFLMRWSFRSFWAMLSTGPGRFWFRFKSLVKQIPVTETCSRRFAICSCFLASPKTFPEQLCPPHSARVPCSPRILLCSLSAAACLCSLVPGSGASLRTPGLPGTAAAIRLLRGCCSAAGTGPSRHSGSRRGEGGWVLLPGITVILTEKMPQLTPFLSVFMWQVEKNSH